MVRYENASSRRRHISVTISLCEPQTVATETSGGNYRDYHRRAIYTQTNYRNRSSEGNVNVST